MNDLESYKDHAKINGDDKNTKVLDILRLYVQLSCNIMISMLCYMSGQKMSIGKSGRIVIEVEPNFKQELYEALGKEGKSLKSWFVENAESFLSDKGQIALSFVDEPNNGARNEV